MTEIFDGKNGAPPILKIKHSAADETNQVSKWNVAIPHFNHPQNKEIIKSSKKYFKVKFSA
uniref:Uncharacterized protein n=1 Tax=Arundo donax TaxID=35708 RepID=A0A0A9G372_ARUDO